MRPRHKHTPEEIARTKENDEVFSTYERLDDDRQVDWQVQFRADCIRNIPGFIEVCRCWKAKGGGYADLILSELAATYPAAYHFWFCSNSEDRRKLSQGVPLMEL